MIPYKYKHYSLEKVVGRAIKISNIRRIIVALSGGADSVALVAALSSIAEFSRQQSITIVAAHCNFHLRGEESMRDQHFVESLCTQLHVPLEIKDFDVYGYKASHPGTSLEMACRDLRYDWFKSLMTEHEADRVATGHNADDNIETLFLNLLRGSGTSGLKGMIEDTGTILRPLLSIHRCQIIEYLESRNLSYITDSSNLTSDFRRNFLRNDVLPLLRQRWPGLDKSLDRSIRLIKSENDIIEKTVMDHLPSPGSPLERTVVLNFPAPELLVRRYILPLSPFTTIPGEIVSAMKADKPDVKRWTLPGGTVTLRGGKLYLAPSE